MKSRYDRRHWRGLLVQAGQAADDPLAIQLPFMFKVLHISVDR
jgi:hypothetical protein